MHDCALTEDAPGTSPATAVRENGSVMKSPPTSFAPASFAPASFAPASFAVTS
jgi:hypothetical protein